MTIARLDWPLCKKFLAIVIANRNPEQTALTSNATAPSRPIFCWTRQAVAGAWRSGVAVATISKSIPLPEIPACLSALIPAWEARSEVSTPAVEMRRSAIPNFCSTQSQSRSAICALRISLLLTIFSGTDMPVAITFKHAWSSLKFVWSTKPISSTFVIC